MHKRFATLQLYAVQRTRIFYAIAEQLGLFENPHPHFSKQELGLDVAPITNLDNLTQAAAVVIPFRRRVEGGEPYSDAVIARLTAKGVATKVIDFMPRLSDDGVHSLASSDELDLERLKTYFAQSTAKGVERTMRFMSRRPQVRAWQSLISEFETVFGIKLEKFKKYPQWLVRRYLAERRGFAELFRVLGTKDLYIVNAYSEPSIVLGAHRAGVRVHEIQHGFISAFHPAYSFGHQAVAGKKLSRSSSGPKIDSAPDTILTWGSYWGAGLTLPKGTSLSVSGPTAPFLEYRTKALSESRIVAKRILFSSQGAVAKELFDAAIETAKTLPDHQIIYRLHPNESLSDFEAILKAKEAQGKSRPVNLTLSHRSPIFLDIVSRSEFLIGAFSTTLFEGLSLGCKVLVLPISGYENVQPAIDDGDITLITRLDDLPSALAAARRVENTDKYYAKEDHV